MVPILSSEILTGGWELVSCGFAFVAALMSYLLTLR